MSTNYTNQRDQITFPPKTPADQPVKRVKPVWKVLGVGGLTLTAFLSASAPAGVRCGQGRRGQPDEPAARGHSDRAGARPGGHQDRARPGDDQDRRGRSSAATGSGRSRHDDH